MVTSTKTQPERELRAGDPAALLDRIEQAQSRRHARSSTSKATRSPRTTRPSSPAFRRSSRVGRSSPSPRRASSTTSIPMRLDRQQPRHRDEAALERRRPAGRPDRRAGPERGARQHLQPSERRAVRRGSPHPNARHEQPDARPTSPGSRRSSTTTARGSGGTSERSSRAILLDPEARGDFKSDPNYGHLREPALFVTGILRAFDARAASGTAPSDGHLNPQTNPMDQDVFRPHVGVQLLPAGLPRSGHHRRRRARVRNPLRVDRAAARELRQHDRVFHDRREHERPERDLDRPSPRSRRSPPNPTALVAELDRLLLHGTMSTAMRDSIVTAVNAVPTGTNQMRDRARAALYLVATSSQYQVQR